MTLLKRRYGWTVWHLLASLGLVTAGIAVTFDAWRDILVIATKDEEASHIFLVPIVAAWLVWVRRERFRYCRPIHTAIGPVLIAIGWIISLLGYNHAIQAFWHGGSLIVVVGCLLTIVGRDVLFRFLPAFAVLIFLVPVPGVARQQVAIPLQKATALATQVAFELFGINVERTGNVLSINGIDVAIAEACNGMRMVFALLLISYAFAFGTILRNYARLLILVASPLSAIACNVIRLLPTVWIYGNYPKSLAATVHDISGWLMLPVAFIILMGVIKLLRWALIPVTPYTLAYD